MKPVVTSIAAIVLQILCVSSPGAISSTSRNLVCNSSFRNGTNDWHFFVIRANARGRIDSIAITAGQNSYEFEESDSGEAFLHSCVFDVNPSGRYRVSLWIRGQGRLRFEMLWWKVYSGTFIQASMDPLDTLLERHATGKWTKVEGVVSSPKDATRAYVRLIASGGNIWIEDVEARPVGSSKR